MAATSSRHFVRRLTERLGMREMYIGPDFSLGRGGEGNANALQALGNQFGFALHIVGPVLSDGAAIHSSRIRNAIREGNVAAAARMLGHRYRVSGEVVHGAGRGRTLGFPTANVEAPPNKLIPPNAVYAACAQVDGRKHRSVVNVGVRPSFDNGLRTIEAHLLDFAGDLYGKTLAVDFIEWMRAERRFNSVDELIEQIQLDCARARELLCEEPPHAASRRCG
jgi:riboflavin kinase / FMN adenylyltransferase